MEVTATLGTQAEATKQHARSRKQFCKLCTQNEAVISKCLPLQMWLCCSLVTTQNSEGLGLKMCLFLPILSHQLISNCHSPARRRLYHFSFYLMKTSRLCSLSNFEAKKIKLDLFE